MTKRWTISKVIACGVLTIHGVATFVVLWFAYLSIERQFTGSLPYLTTLIGALQGAAAVVLSAYFGKSRAENTRGGIVYDAALGGDEQC